MSIEVVHAFLTETVKVRGVGRINGIGTQAVEDEHDGQTRLAERGFGRG
jgi:hypothetical protein